MNDQLAFIKANSTDKAYLEISNKAGQFVDLYLYPAVYGLDGGVRAHGAKENRAQAHVLRKTGRHSGLRRHLQMTPALTLLTLGIATLPSPIELNAEHAP